MTSTVLLGPEAMLHNGIHGALVAAPPAGIRYERRSAIHVVLCPPTAASPFDALPLAEAVDFGHGIEIVQSVYFPVLHRQRWIVECAELSYALFCGQYMFTDDFRRDYAVRTSRRAEHTQRMLERARRMFAAYAHPTCLGILIYTDQERKRVESWAERLCDSVTATAVLDKLRLCCPAVQAISQDSFLEKWRDLTPMRVLFSGRWFNAKHGALALRAFDAIRLALPSAALTYVGPIPDNVRERHAPLLNSITHMERVDHSSMLALIRDAHILMFPSGHESLGVTVLEAMAAGTAVVARRGRGLAHFDEWFADGGAVLVDLDPGGTRNDDAFISSAAALTLDGQRARAIAEHCWDQASRGTVSLAARDRVLSALYEHPEPRVEPLSVAQLAPGESYRVHRSTCHVSMQARARVAATAGVDYLRFELDL